MSTVAVAGGTGVVGRHVVEVARARGHDIRVLTRSTGVDLTTGDGLDLTGVDAVVDVTSVKTTSRRAAEEFFGSVTRHLLAAGKSAGVRHHVALSIVGIDDVPYGYYQGKQEQERIITGSDVPWSILRATQFHEFSEQALGFVTLGKLSLVPTMLSQPVAAVEVAEKLVDLVESGPTGRAPDFGGPDRLQMVDMARRVNQQRGLGRRVIALPVPGATGRGMRSGALCTTDGQTGRQTFADWLAR